MKVINPKLSFRSLNELESVDLIVIHHTATTSDVSAEQIHSWHLDFGWSGCGYQW